MEHKMEHRKHSFCLLWTLKEGQVYNRRFCFNQSDSWKKKTVYMKSQANENLLLCQNLSTRPRLRQFANSLFRAAHLLNTFCHFVLV